MSSRFRRSGRVCLFQVGETFELGDILRLLAELERAGKSANSALLLLIHISASLAPPAPNVREAFTNSLPAVFAACDSLIVAIESSGTQRELLRSFFRFGSHLIAAGKTIDLVETLDTALLHARRAAPHDVLQLQRRLWRKPGTEGS